MTRTKRLVLLLLVAVVVAGTWGNRAWQAHQAAVARLAAEQRADAEWDRLQAVETERLAREWQAGLQFARTRLAEIAAEGQRHGVLSVVTDPAGASLTLLPANATEPPTQGTTPFSLKLPKGKYHLSLVLAGHESHEEPVALTDTEQSLRIDLRPVPVVPPRLPEAAINPGPKPDANMPPAPDTITRPQLIAPVTAEYPPDLLRAGISGSAVVAFTVDAEGRVTQTQVVESTHPGFAAPAEKAVQKCRYKPAQENGRPVPYRLRTTIRFKLDEGAGLDLPGRTKDFRRSAGLGALENLIRLYR